MPNNEKKNTDFEIGNKEVINNIPKVDDKSYEKINKLNDKMRKMDTEDTEEISSENQESNDIIDSLLAYSETNNLEVNVEKKEKTKFSFLSFFNKKTFSNKNKKNKKNKNITVNDIMNGEIPNNNNEESIHDDKTLDENLPTGNDIEINTLDDIQNIITDSHKKNKLKMPSKNILILISSIVILAIFISAIFVFIDKNKMPTTEPSQEPPIVKQEDNFISSNIDTNIYKQGTIKRILGNKVLIVPDDEKENIIYYVENTSLLNEFSAGDHVEYGYTIYNYLPYIDSIIKIKEGIVTYKGIMTINIMVDNVPVKFTYDSSIEDKLKTISTGDSIQYVFKDIDGVPNITNIIEINGANTEIVDEIVSEDVGENPMTEDLYNGYVYNKNDFYNEYLVIDNREKEEMIVTKSNIENNTIEFYNGLTGPIWIRHAWRSTELAETVPTIENVEVILETPSGIKITNDNISEYGRMWIDENVINYAIKQPEVGEYKFVDKKPNGTFLGEASIFLMGLSGFITIDKFGANLLDRDTLELVWNIGGVPDDGLEIEVYLTNDRFSTMVYSGSSKTEELHTIDKRIVAISNLPKGKYNVLVTVKDIDLKTQSDNKEIPENTLVVTAETIKDTKNVGILILQ